VSAIVKYFKSKNRKADYTTISQYISYMQHAYIVTEAPRYSFKTKELLSGERKYFISDLGFRNYLFPTLQKDIGSILENIAYTHLRIAGYEVKVGIGVNFEVDFVAQKQNKKQYVQVTYVMPNAKTQEKEFVALEKIKDNLPKTVVNMDDILIPNDLGISHEYIWDFIYRLSIEKS
jgi:predicted AAA+ superfamily ATPase